MKNIFKIIIITFVIGLVSCSSNNEEGVNQNLKEKINSFHKKKSNIIIDPVNLNKFSIKQRQFDIAWLYDEIGKDFAIYTSKIKNDQFSKDEIYKLLKRAYIPHDDEFRYTHKRAAIYALCASLYRDLYINVYNENLIEFRNIAYSPEFIKIISKENNNIISNIPINLSNYYQLIFDSIKRNVRSYELLTMQIKTDPKVLNYLFYTINKSYTHRYQVLAINYATYEQAKEYLSRNGLLLEFVNKEFQDNSILVYTALLQNEKAIAFASPRLRRIVETSGPEKLIGLSARIYLLKDSIEQRSSDIWYISKEKTFNTFESIVNFTNNNYQKARSFIFNEELEEEFVNQELEEEKLESNRTMIPFTEDNSIVTDIKTIISIQDIHNRPLRNLWRIAKINRQKEIFIAYYQPQGRRYLASIIYKNGENYVVSDYKASLTQDGSTIWRYLDYGKFNPKLIKIVDIEEVKTKELRVKMKWVGKERSSLYMLSEKNGKFVKEFISHSNNIK